MTPHRVLVSDDEPAARQRLRELVNEAPDFECLRECADGPATVAALREESFDLVLLDVQMPGMDGFEVVRTIGPEHMPALVFVTAHDRFALDAFEVEAIDYLLKPFDPARFHAMLARVRRSLERAEPTVSKLEALLAHRRAELSGQLVLRTGKRILVLAPDEVEWIEAAGNYLRFHVGDDVHLVRTTLASMEERLAATFVRIHRSLLVRGGAIRELRPTGEGEYVLLLASGRTLATGRKYRANVEAFLHGTP